MRRVLIAGLVAGATTLFAACRSNEGGDRTAYVAAARTLTHRYAISQLAQWKLQARAAGADCSVLVIQTDVTLADSMVDALHKGDAAYDVYPGGIRQYAQERAFRGVLYRDDTPKWWAYGFSYDNAPLQPCP